VILRILSAGLFYNCSRINNKSTQLLNKGQK
jgi:hypothetical protein